MRIFGTWSYAPYKSQNSSESKDDQILYSYKSIFLELSGRSTVLAGIQGIPPPPSAAPAAGGGGIPRSVLVYSVGAFGAPADGVVEVARLSAWILLVELFPSDGGVLRVAAIELLPFRCSWIYGFGEYLKPSPDRSSRSIWIVKSKMELVLLFVATVAAAWGAGSSEPVIGVFPSAEGLLPSQGMKWSSGGGANWSRPGARRRRRGSVVLICIFPLYWTYL
jgi:hypothetical protein